MKNRKKIISSRWVKINVFFIILIIVVISFSTIRELYLFTSSIDFYKQELVEYKTDEVKQEVQNRVDEIDSILNISEENFHNELMLIINDVDHFASHSLSGLEEDASLDEKRSLYLDTIYQYDLYDEDYLFFAIDLKGVAWLMGLNKSDEGSDISNLQDSITGDFITLDMIDKIQNSPDGTDLHTYYFPKAIGGEALKKTSYIKYNKEVELFIGTGVYYDDYLASVKEDYINRLRTYYDNSIEYIYLYSYDATPLIHADPTFDKKQLLSILDESSQPLHYKLVEEVRKEGVYEFKYQYKNDNKYGIIYDVPEWDVYIGQSFKMDDVNKLMDVYIKNNLKNFIFSLLILTFITLSLMLYIKNLMKRNLKDIVDEFTEQNNLIKKLSLTDNLTGLNNRKYFNTAYEELIKDIEKYSIIVADANGLKLTNDAFGHDEGDKLLVTISDYLKTVFAGDYIFRWGGDEFLILSLSYEKNHIDSKLEKFNKLAMSTPKSHIHVSVAFGFAIARKDDDVYELMKIAEQMMYDRKMSESSSQKRMIIDNILNTLYDSYNFEKNHSENVMKNAVAIGKELKLSKEELSHLRLGALLHDIGKITIPDKIITSTEKLTNEEYAEIKKHSEKGYRILQAYPELSQYAIVAYNHHEKYDGSGYPRGISGEDIPLFSRIIAVADAYDAMTADRIYKIALTHEEAKKELLRCKGSHFDPQIVDAFINTLDT